MRFGIEIEGGWHRSREFFPILWHDGSVAPHGVAVPTAWGEYGTVDGGVDLKGALQFINTYWPEEVNNSCGYHIHVSMTQHQYASLMEDTFWGAWTDGMKAFARKIRDENEQERFMERLEGNNQYCRSEWNPFMQYKQSTKHNSRYTQLNFCWSLHGTMECRVFPAFKSKGNAIRAFAAHVGTIKRFLKSHELPLDGAEIVVSDQTQEMEVAASCA